MSWMEHVSYVENLKKIETKINSTDTVENSVTHKNKHLEKLTSTGRIESEKERVKYRIACLRDRCK